MALNDTHDNKKPNNPQDLNDHHIITSRYTLHVTESHVDFVLTSSSRTGKKETARHTFHSRQRYSQSHLKFSRSCVRAFTSHLMSADFPAAAGRSHFESLQADSCGLCRAGKSTTSTHSFSKVCPF